MGSKYILAGFQYSRTMYSPILSSSRARARGRTLANFTPIHHWDGDELKLGLIRNFFGEMHFTPFLHDVGAKNLMGRLRAKP